MFIKLNSVTIKSVTIVVHLYFLQDVHILKTTWAVAFASLCPRLVPFYLYLFDYENSFLLAVNITSPRSENDEISKYTLNVSRPALVNILFIDIDDMYFWGAGLHCKFFK